MDDDIYYLDDQDAPELHPMGLKEIAETFCRAASTLTPEQKAECRAALEEKLGVKTIQLQWAQLLNEDDRSFLREARIRCD